MTGKQAFPFEFPVLGTGQALPRRCVTNAELVELLAARGVETSDEWIQERTGITQRYWCDDRENTFTLAQNAVAQALERTGVTATQVGVLVVATCTPNLSFPSVAAQVHGALGMGPGCVALDVNAACSGFIDALMVARGLLASMPESLAYAVVVGAEQFSKLLDLDDRTTCVLFGDGAGALVLGRKQLDISQVAENGLLAVQGGTNGALGPALTTTSAGTIFMNGRDVYKHAVRQMGAVPAVLAEVGLTVDEVDLVVPHQANVRILQAAAESMGVPARKMMVTVNRHANTSAASIPLALDVAVEEGLLQRGAVVLMQAFGAGFTWGEAVVRW